ncbi:MAG: NPCBM/NEW2 domain-containing protein, partial [Verrucomicrobiota bacterium]|nr:NPCBM/NEW2 domain-containing protein [Verrucomicrobiota bacterium]
MYHCHYSRFFLSLSLAFAAVSSARALTNNVALTPPMGWNDWNSYHCGINEAGVTNTANVIASNGMEAAGYQFVDIDDGWAGSRNAYGVILPYTNFPDGIQWLANYVHSMGLKLGIYTDHGTNTCSHCINTSFSPDGKQPGSFGHEYVDALTYGQWGVDYLKEDNCNVPATANAEVDYGLMSDGLMKSGQPIVFCLCGGAGTTGRKGYQSWSPVLGNYWRTTGDIGSSFSSMISHLDPNSQSAFAAGPGRWNDPDMMEIGNGEFVTNLVGAQTHFTMWCEMAAPLIAGNNLSTMSAQSLAILTNGEAIAVDQDPAGEQGVFVAGIQDSAEVWSKALGYDFTTRAVALLNRSSTTPATITCYFTNLAFQAGTTATVRDLWAHQDLGTFTDSYTATIPPFGSMLLKIVGTPIPAPPLGTNYLSDRQPVYRYTGWPSWLSVSNDSSIGGNPITLGGVVYPKGIGVNARSGVEYDLGGDCSQFHAVIGVDDEVGSNGSVIFQVFADGQQIYDSGVMTGGSPAKTVDLDVTGVRRLVMGVGDADDGTSNDHADWADAYVVVTNTTPQPPHAPTGLTAIAGDQIRLTWNPTVCATNYNIKRATVSGGPYTIIGTSPIAVLTDTNVTMGVTYYYVVSAMSSIGESSNSLEAVASPCAMPAVPTNLTASAGTSSITLTWNSSPGATSYNVYDFGGSTAPVLLSSGITGTNFTQGSLSPATTNYYLVTAVNSCNESHYSDFTAAVTPPAAPTALTATPGDNSVALGWTAPAGSTGFNVKRSLVSGGPYALIASNVVNAGYLDFSVTNGTTYYYVVSAIGVSGEGPDSAEAGATPAQPPTAYWTNTAAGTPQNWDVNGNWTNSPAYPNEGGAGAIVEAPITGPQTVDLNVPIAVGDLEIGDPNGVNSYTLAANGGSLTFSSTNTCSLTQIASSKGDVLATPVTMTTNLVVVNNSTNPLTLAGPLSAWAGTTLTIGSGTLQVGDGGNDGSLGAANVADNAELIFDSSGGMTNSGVISGSGFVTQEGAGTVTLSGANTFTGGLTIENGTVQAGNTAALGSTSSATTITNGGTLDVNGISLSGSPIIVSGAGVGGNGAIVNSGPQQTAALRNVTMA